MSEWHIVVTGAARDGRSLRLDLGGSVEPSWEVEMHDIIVSMREGLEANGWVVQASMTYSEKIDL